MEITNETAQKILKFLEDAEKKNLYLFMSDDETILESEFLESHEQALEYARTLDCPVVNILLHIGCADHREEYYDIF